MNDGSFPPLTQKAGLLVIVTIMLHSSGANEWNIYDKYRCFSVTERLQIRLVCITFVASLTDGVFAHYETDSLILYGPDVAPNFISIVHSKILSNELILGRLINIFLMIVALVSYTVRYKPLLNMIYAALCVKHHLAHINRQLLPLSCRIKGSLMSSATSPTGELERDVARAAAAAAAHHQQARPSIAGLSIRSLRRKTIHTSSESPLSSSCTSYSTVDSLLAPKSSRSSSGGGGGVQTNRLKLSYAKNLRPDLQSQARRRRRQYDDHVMDDQLMANILNGHSPTVERGTSGARAIEINNLPQLEAHIAKLALFVDEIDRCNGTVVYLMCLQSMIQFIYCFFFILEAKFEDIWRVIVSCVFTLSRLTVPVYLFMCGNYVEQQAKLMITQLETIYLQDPAKGSIYERYSGTKAISSLARLIRSLNSIHFSCDGLMGINLSTLKSFVVQSVTAMFIIIQYGEYPLAFHPSASVLPIESVAA